MAVAAGLLRIHSAPSADMAEALLGALEEKRAGNRRPALAKYASVA